MTLLKSSSASRCHELKRAADPCARAGGRRFSAAGQVVALAFAGLLVLWQFLPWIERQFVRLDAEPRAVTARGDLAGDEQSTIELFERISPSVVYITTRQRVVNPWTRNITSVQRGSGSGFFWDDLGHVVTNHHVIEGASEAVVSLNDGGSYRAVLVGSSPAHDLAVLRIWVEADEALRHDRTVQREGADAAIALREWWPREERHFAGEATRARADLIIDGIAGPDAPRNFAASAPLGQVIYMGAVGGYAPPVDISRELYAKSIAVRGYMVYAARAATGGAEPVRAASRASRTYSASTALGSSRLSSSRP